MNREIKFRAWIKEVYENGEFAYGGYMIEPELIKSIHVNKSGTLMNGQRGTGIEYFVQGSFLPGMGFHELARFDEIVLMQYIELKDKNGQEIFEMDVLEKVSTFSGNIYRYQVEWDDKNARYIAVSIGGVLRELVSDALGRGCVKVGNIYENPEFLHSKDVIVSTASERADKEDVDE